MRAPDLVSPAPAATVGADARRPLIVAQFLNLRRQIAPLYLMLSVNAAALAFTHQNLAPPLLTRAIPLMLVLASLARLFHWVRPIDLQAIDINAVTRRMHSTTVFAVVFSLAFVLWALWLDRYGGPYEHGHVAIFIAVTVMGVVFCLGYLPRSAHAVTYSVLGIFLAYCLYNGTPVMIAIAINIGLVGIVVLKVLRDSFASFVELEASRQALEIERASAHRLSEENARLAHSDALTGLPNRRYFFARLDAMLARDRADAPFCIGVIDLDRFKPVNDTLGHAQGDRLLQAVGDRLRALCTAEVTIARLGGDEFGLIVEGDMEAAARVGQQICEKIQHPIQLGDTAVAVGCSGGLASWPEAGSSAHDLFDRADFALYHAKKKHRGTCVRFSGTLEKLIRSEQALEAALQTADLDRELDVVFQPVVSTRTMEISGLEALARWSSPTLGPVPAEMLFTTAERLGIARTITLTLFGKVLAQMARMPADMRVSFNLAPADIADPETVYGLLTMIDVSGKCADRLIFEITENSLIHDPDVARGALEQLRTAGARIALDDFGTGYSSLSTLHQLPLDILKIDRSFAARLDDPVGRRLVSAIRTLARTLSLSCVFEGIETEIQLMEATLAGYDYVQGYLLAKPDTLDAVLNIQLPGRSAAA
ncbi:putative bifunctional diguanylate cyclase/phosphodiesterase [Novosphingobium olei]|uniref:EAL domain-containing protein n=1 Tax=Novosphingobium olei TaxID=2728851 RepID=A0A7Y0GC35_9SPHN|nr:EAL domain-containing protein [Novosphingobium olei]NML95212.1 EAL domain-containing protein [Novosphingobium olei]